MKRRKAIEKLPGEVAPRRGGALLPLAAAISAVLYGMPALVQSEEAAGTLTEIIVTAQKKSENLQDVPVSIQALDAQKLEQLHVENFGDYVKYLPSVSFQNEGPGSAKIYMRGVSSGGDGVHSGSLPSVGVYLDEQPVTTIQGVLDVHMYDIARVEALAGPQGTLYGASSEAGTLRIITNKPEFDTLKGAYDVEVNDIKHGGVGYTAEGFVNIPIGAAAAIRLVGWYEKDAGFLDNVPGSLTYPATYADGAPGIIATNNNNAAPANRAPNTAYTGTAGKAYNDVETKGARAALRVALSDNWTLTSTLQGQTQHANGEFATEQTKAVPGYPGLYNPLGDLQVQQFFPDYASDDWLQTTLTIEGKISDFDVTYAGGFVHRTSHFESDYTDYSVAYAIAYNRGPLYYTDNAGHAVNPTQQFLDTDGYKMYSHELRVTTPKEYPVRATVGAFLQQQTDTFLQNYFIEGLATAQSVTGYPGTLYLTNELLIHRDTAVFGEVTWDVDSHWSLLGGLRYYKYHNTQQGFSGFNFNEATCPNPTQPDSLGNSCQEFFKVAEATGTTPKGTVTYKFDDQRLVYATVSTGFRPGGPNTYGPSYSQDTLRNYEVGWKTSWLGNSLRVNGAVFQEDWKDFQFAYAGQSGIIEIKNAAGARIRGLETSVDWAASRELTLAAGVTLMNPILTVPFCKYADQNGAIQTATCINYGGATPVAEPFGAPAGQDLPTTPKFKGDLTARYSAPLAGDWQGHAQGAFVYQSAVWPDLRTHERTVLGQQPAYGLLDLSFGAQKEGLGLELFVNNVFDRRAEQYRYSECTAGTCGPLAVYHVIYKPRLIGLKFSEKF
ncbi:MAG: TonB-dependent receptor [Steroidobacterales bacterium]